MLQDVRHIEMFVSQCKSVCVFEASSLRTTSAWSRRTCSNDSHNSFVGTQGTPAISLFSSKQSLSYLACWFSRGTERFKCTQGCGRRDQINSSSTVVVTAARQPASVRQPIFWLVAILFRSYGLPLGRMNGEDTMPTTPYQCRFHAPPTLAFTKWVLPHAAPIDNDDNNDRMPLFLLPKQQAALLRPSTYHPYHFSCRVTPLLWLKLGHLNRSVSVQ